MDNFDKYLKLVKWAKTRYTTNSVLILSIGGVSSRFSEIEELAAKKYLLED